MPNMKPNKKYYFTVDGETEQWYFEWLQQKINQETSSRYTVSFDYPIKNPLKRAKAWILPGKEEITHICDYESEDEIHTTHFRETLDAMKEAQKLGKQITYKLGYSNFTFELWMILHKRDCFGSLNHRKNYLRLINQCYKEEFENLKAYKHEDNFKRVLGKVSLPHVKAAINRAERLTKLKEENGFKPQQYKGYFFYTENPSLSIWEAIRKILKDCRLLD